jgi:hypothetical protein
VGIEEESYMQLTVRDWPPERMLVIDLDIEGFSATQRTCIDSDLLLAPFMVEENERTNLCYFRES